MHRAADVNATGSPQGPVVELIGGERSLWSRYAVRTARLSRNAMKVKMRGLKGSAHLAAPFKISITFKEGP